MKKSLLVPLAALFAISACGESANRTPTGLRVAGPSMSVSGTEGAIVATDKNDYAPGETVIITGTGWEAGETVHLTITEEPVVDGAHESDVIADENGSFTDASFTPGTQHLGVTFTLTATGQTSGTVARLTFTDGAKRFKGQVSPASAAAGETKEYTFTITNCTETNPLDACGEPNGQGFDPVGRVRITVPADFTAVSIVANSLTKPAGKSWTASIPAGAGYIELVAASNAHALSEGEAVSVKVEAKAPSPSVSTPYAWTTAANQNPATTTFLSPTHNLVGGQPTVTVGAAVVPSFQLTVTKSGAGTGTVSSTSPVSTPAGIDCGTDCLETYTSGTAVTLTAVEGTNSTFNGWTGACTNATGSCSVTMDAAKTVNALFKANQTISYVTGTPTTKTYGEPGFTVNATASSGLTVNLAAKSGVTACTVTDNADGTAAVSIVSPGSCVIVASQSGNGSYNAATPVEHTITIARAPTTTSISLSVGPYILNGEITISANVVPTNDASPYSYASRPSGSVTITENASPICVITLTAGSPSTGSCPAGSYKPGTVGTHTLRADYSGDANFLTDDDTKSFAVTYRFEGFSAPVDRPNTLNLSKAGQAIPLKWRLTDADGIAVTNLASVSVRVTDLACNSLANADQIEEYATGSTTLQNLGDGYYQFNWKSPTGYAGSCKSLGILLGSEASVRTNLAYFTFKK